MTGGDGRLLAPERREARRFLAWGGAFVGMAVILTLYWGMIQDGDMYYYNAWFNFGLYYFGLLVAVGVVCERTMGAERFTGREQAAVLIERLR